MTTDHRIIHKISNYSLAKLSRVDPTTVFQLFKTTFLIARWIVNILTGSPPKKLVDYGSDLLVVNPPNRRPSSVLNNSLEPVDKWLQQQPTLKYVFRRHIT